MNKLDRVRLTVQGKQTDRIPYSFWTHFPDIDLDAQKLAEETHSFYRRLDLDFVKNMSNGMFSIEDWGCELDFSQVALGGVAKVTKFAVETPGDWLKLAELNVEHGALGRELKSLSTLLKLVNGEAPVIATVFSPLTTAQKLSGAALKRHMQSDPDKVKAALEVITHSTARFATRALELGCAGVYFASQMSSFENLTGAEYQEFGVKYDLAILNAIQTGSWFNVMHVHGNDIMFNLLKNYPVQGISWHVWETAPSPQEFLDSVASTCIVGGLQRFNITDNKRTKLAEEISAMIEITGGKRLFLAPGCVIRAPFDWDTLDFIRETISKKSMVIT